MMRSASMLRALPRAAGLAGLLLLVAAAACASAADRGALEKAPLVLSLERAVELGLAGDETLLQARQRILAAEAGVREARSTRIPRLDLSARYGRNILKPVLFLPSDMGDAFGGITKIELGEDNDITAAASASWNIWTFGRSSAAMAAASELAAAARHGRIAAADYVRFAVREAYYGALLAGEILAIDEKAVETTAEAVRVARTAYEQGVVSRFELLRAEVELENRHAPLVRARNDAARALLMLKRRCGLDPEAMVILSDTLGHVAPPAPLELLLGAMRGANPEIRALEHRVGSARMFLRLERADRRPALQLGAAYVLQSQWSGRTLPGDENLAHSSAVTLGVVYPLFDGLRSRARIDRARADLRGAEFELERAFRDKELAVRIARLNLESAIAALQGRRETVALAGEAYRLAEVLLRSGLATPLERLDAELALTAARAQYAQALYAANVAEAALELTAGGAGLHGTAPRGAAPGKETDDE